MGAAARQRGDALIRCHLDKETRAAYASAHTRAWADITIVGRSLAGLIDVGVWFETYAGDLFGFSRFEARSPADIRPTAQRHFASWCRQHGVSAEVLYPTPEEP